MISFSICHFYFYSAVDTSTNDINNPITCKVYIKCRCLWAYEWTKMNRELVQKTIQSLKPKPAWYIKNQTSQLHVNPLSANHIWVDSFSFWYRILLEIFFKKRCVLYCGIYSCILEPLNRSVQIVLMWQINVFCSVCGRMYDLYMWGIAMYLAHKDQRYINMYIYIVIHV